MKFPELTYANPTDGPLKRCTIQTIERLVGRDYFVPLYERWQTEYVAGGGRVIGPMLELIDVKLEVTGTWPPALDPTAPLVIVANHPYGIVDGIAALSLAESLGRPFRVLINKDLMKIPEIRPYSLPIDFTETRAAQEENIRTRHEALRLLRAGATIVVFPAGGVATSPTTFGRAVDLPWKTFTARMIQAARAQVLPIYFAGQCRPLFHFVSKFSLTLRLSLMIAELRRRVGTTLEATVGPVVPFDELNGQKDRLLLMNELWDRVHRLSPHPLAETRERTERLPKWLGGEKFDER
jgi:putative hemolysin